MNINKIGDFFILSKEYNSAVTVEDVLKNPKGWGDLATWIEQILMDDGLSRKNFVRCGRCHYEGKVVNEFGKTWIEGDNQRYCGNCGEEFK